MQIAVEFLDAVPTVFQFLSNKGKGKHICLCFIKQHTMKVCGGMEV
jgi:hypothetical protein